MKEKSLSELQIGDVRTCRWLETCVACGGRYHPKYKKIGPALKDVVCVSDHKCSRRRLAKREAQLRHEFDDPPRGCECDDLDCKFEYLDEIRLEMQ